MRKKLTVLVLLGLALVLLAGPALAAGSGRGTYVAKKGTKQGVKRTPQVISLTGTISFENGAMFVAIQMTNVAFRSFRSTTKKVLTTSKTTYIWWNKDRTRDLTKGFDDLTTGQKVAINGLVKDGVITARRIEVNKPRIP